MRWPGMPPWQRGWRQDLWESKTFWGLLGGSRTWHGSEDDGEGEKDDGLGWDLGVGVGKIGKSLVPWSGVDCGLQGYRLGCWVQGKGLIIILAVEEGMKRVRAPLPRLPPVLPAPAADRARHRTGNHMVAEVSRGRQVANQQLKSLPEKLLKALIPPRAPPLPCWHLEASQGPAPAAWGLDTSSHLRAEEGT